MRTVPFAILTGPTVGCWRITRRDGVVLQSTELDADIVIESGDLAGTYSSTNSITGSTSAGADDLSTANMEAVGTLQADGDFVIDGITPQDIEAGLIDTAHATYFLVNWRLPQAGAHILLDGTLGNIQRDSTGKWTCELRGLTHRYTQAIGDTYTTACDAKFGDSRCGVNRDDYAITGAVTVPSGTRQFTAAVVSPSPAVPNSRFTGGEIRFDTGLNAGYSKEVKNFDGSIVELWEAFPFVVAATDTFTMWPDCFKDRESCKFYGNVVRFRGFPDFSGSDVMTKLRTGPLRKGQKGGGK